MSRRVELLMWAGILVAPAAWTVQHVLSYGVSEARCDPAGRRWGISYDAWIVSFGALAIALAVVGLIAALSAYRAVRDVSVDDDPPPGRIWLMSVCGLVISPLFIAAILLSSTGALLLAHCHQG
jgi:hypothetical protein